MVDTTNRDFPHGLRPWSPHGGVIQKTLYDATTTTAIYEGDVVARRAEGKVYPLVTTSGSDAIVGVAAEYSGTAAADTEVLVYDDPNQRFEIQDDGTTSGTSSNVKHGGATCALTVTTGNTTTKISKQELDISGTGAAQTDPVMIVDYVRASDNTHTQSHLRWVVILQRHMYGRRHNAYGI